VKHAAIYGDDGTAWSVSSDWPGLTEYQHPMQQDDGSTRNVLVNEFKGLLSVTSGNAMPTEAGVRLGNERYIFKEHEPAMQMAQLERQEGGGAVVMKTKKGLIIGIWLESEQMFEDNRPQGP